jgi:hypothetical protein
MLASLLISVRRSCVPPRSRRGNVLVLAAFLMVVMVAFVALGIDIGTISVARTELQRAADSAAMASAWEMLDENRLRGAEYLSAVQVRARVTAADYAQRNRVWGTAPAVDLNEANQEAGDVLIGRFSDGALSTGGSSATHNAVRVRVLRNQTRNQEVPFFFARAFGVKSQATSAEAIAMFRDGVSGFRATESTGNTSLLPFALNINEWTKLMAGSGPDNWTYNPDTKSVRPGGDGVREIKLFPAKESKGSGITPGNFGTIDIGGADNSSSILKRQISEGVSAEDLAHHGGELKLDPGTRTLELNGETGMSAGMDLALPDVVGKPRTIPLYSKVVSGGNTAQYTIVGFVGVRVVDFNLNGGDKYIMIQPAVVVDDTVITSNSPTSYNVFQPVILVQ